MTAAPLPPDADPPPAFPDRYTPEADAPAYLHVRAEGLPLREAAWSGVGYLRKYRHAKWTAPSEEVAHFDDQRRLLRWLRGRPAGEARLALVGDLMWLRSGWGEFLSSEVLAYLNGHDLVLGNLETPISARFRVPRLLPGLFYLQFRPAIGHLVPPARRRRRVRRPGDGEQLQPRPRRRRAGRHAGAARSARDRSRRRSPERRRSAVGRAAPASAIGF
ncbi:MAG: hypothetical protein U0736_28115 [Gemmataceae bacterium]